MLRNDFRKSHATGPRNSCVNGDMMGMFSSSYIRARCSSRVCLNLQHSMHPEVDPQNAEDHWSSEGATIIEVTKSRLLQLLQLAQRCNKLKYWMLFCPSRRNGEANPLLASIVSKAMSELTRYLTGVNSYQCSRRKLSVDAAAVRTEGVHRFVRLSHFVFA